MNRSRVKMVLAALGVFFVAIQIFQPARTNPASVPSRSLAAHVNIPEAVYTPLMRGCGDCHSNQTIWPWYSHVAPLSWVITDDVNEGRRHMNLDDWEALGSSTEANKRVVGICEEIRRKGMPPFSFRVLHRDLSLKANEIDSICVWSNSGPMVPVVTDARP
jgi:hypothetical protein